MEPVPAVETVTQLRAKADQLRSAASTVTATAGLGAATTTITVEEQLAMLAAEIADVAAITADHIESCFMYTPPGEGQ